MFKTPSGPSTFKLFEENFRKDPSEVVYGGKVNTGMDGLHESAAVSNEEFDRIAELLRKAAVDPHLKIVE